MYLSKPARDMLLLLLAEDGSVSYKLLYTKELFALLELERKGLIVEAPNAEYQPGEGNKKRSNRNKKAIYAELCLRFIPYLRFFFALFLFFFALFFFSLSYLRFLGKLPLV